MIQQGEQSRGGSEIIIPHYSSHSDGWNSKYDEDHDDNAKISERITPLMSLTPSLAISDSFLAKKIVSTSRLLDVAACVFFLHHIGNISNFITEIEFKKHYEHTQLCD